MNTKIISNYFKGHVGATLLMAAADNVKFARNRMDQDAGMVEVAFSTNIEISSNSWFASTLNAVALDGLNDGVTVSGNNFDNNQGFAMRAGEFADNANVTFSDNRIIQDVGVLAAAGAMVEIEGLSGVNTFNSNYMLLAGTLSVSHIDGYQFKGGSAPATVDFYGNTLGGGSVDTSNVVKSVGLVLDASLASGFAMTGTTNYIAGWHNGIEAGLLDGGVAIQLTDGQIFGNSEFGAKNGAGAQLNLTHNWWGSATGPQHSSNPGGTGNPVTDNIIFTPFETAQP